MNPITELTLDNLFADAAGIRCIETLYATGHTLHRQARYHDAATVFRLMLHVAPIDERSWLALGECHERLGQHVVALELYSAGTVVAAPARRCMLARARVLSELGRDGEAADAYEHAAELAEAAHDEALVGAIRAEMAA